MSDHRESRATEKGCGIVLLIVICLVVTGLMLPLDPPPWERFLMSIGVLSYRNDARRGLCINNLRLIDHAKEVLAIKNSWTNGYVIAATPDDLYAVLDIYIDGTNRLTCPDLPRGTHYIYGVVDETPRCPLGGEHVYVPAGESSWSRCDPGEGPRF